MTLLLLQRPFQRLAGLALALLLAACGGSEVGGGVSAGADTGSGGSTDLGSAPAADGRGALDPGSGGGDPGGPGGDLGVTADSGLPVDDFQKPCGSGLDCESGFCVPSPSGDVCTVSCLSSCPGGWSCRLIQNPSQDPIFLCLHPDVGGGGGGDLDSDGDGVPDLLDCAPEDPKAYPGNQEVCGDGRDNDCDPSTTCFVVRWGGGQVEQAYRPLRTKDSAETFYGYQRQWAGTSDTGFERRNSSVFFLLVDAVGDLHFVVHHDRAWDFSGGAVDMEIESVGLAGSGVGVELRDDPDTDDDFAWDEGKGRGAFSWSWGPCCGDGMVLGPLPRDRAFCLRPSWIEAQGIDHFRLLRTGANGPGMVELQPGQLQGLELCATP